MILDISQHNKKIRYKLDYLKSLEEERKNSNSHKTNKGYIEWMNMFEYCYFLTITFQYDSTLHQRVQHVNKLLMYMNERIFGKRYFKKNEFLEGFAVVEFHKSGLPHLHIIFKTNSKIDREGYSTFKDIINLTSNKVRYGVGTSGTQVFGRYSIVLKEVYDGNIVKYDKDGVEKEGDIVGYVTKDIWKSNGNTVYPLSKEGILYTDLDNVHH